MAFNFGIGINKPNSPVEPVKTPAPRDTPKKQKKPVETPVNDEKRTTFSIFLDEAEIDFIAHTAKRLRLTRGKFIISCIKALIERSKNGEDIISFMNGIAEADAVKESGKLKRISLAINSSTMNDIKACAKRLNISHAGLASVAVSMALKPNKTTTKVVH